MRDWLYATLLVGGIFLSGVLAALLNIAVYWLFKHL